MYVYRSELYNVRMFDVERTKTYTDIDVGSAFKCLTFDLCSTNIVLM